jgi:hypothetical protein
MSLGSDSLVVAAEKRDELQWALYTLYLIDTIGDMPIYIGSHIVVTRLMRRRHSAIAAFVAS